MLQKVVKLIHSTVSVEVCMSFLVRCIKMTAHDQVVRNRILFSSELAYTSSTWIYQDKNQFSKLKSGSKLTASKIISMT